MPAKTLTLLTLFASAMGLLEAVVVIYMRRLYYPDDPLNIFPLKFLDKYDAVVELSREAATVVMLLSVALMVEQRSRTHTFAAFVFIFGIWDLFYYAWLKVLLGWPTAWLEWDVLFLIPIIWLGPWICPALISVLFVTWGYWVLRSNAPLKFSIRSFVVFGLGAALGLTTFFQPALEIILFAESSQLSQYTPRTFWWWLFVPSLVMMTCGLGLTLRFQSRITSLDAF